MYETCPYSYIRLKSFAPTGMPNKIEHENILCNVARENGECMHSVRETVRPIEQCPSSACTLVSLDEQHFVCCGPLTLFRVAGVTAESRILVRIMCSYTFQMELPHTEWLCEHEQLCRCGTLVYRVNAAS